MKLTPSGRKIFQFDPWKISQVREFLSLKWTPVHFGLIPPSLGGVKHQLPLCLPQTEGTIVHVRNELTQRKSQLQITFNIFQFASQFQLQGTDVYYVLCSHLIALFFNLNDLQHLLGALALLSIINIVFSKSNTVLVHSANCAACVNWYISSDFRRPEGKTLVLTQL